MTAGSDFLVRRDELHETRIVEGPVPEPRDGEVLLRVAKFALTANNVTYAVFGDAMQYWAFFPAPDGWGRVPVWGFADVVASRHPAIAEGERVYGYLPMSTHLRVQPAKETASSFLDATPHRRALPGAYQHYVRAGADAAWGKAQEDLQSLLRPLFMTSWLIADFLADNNDFGAEAAVIASASSKTALGLAFELDRNRGARLRRIALTSERNMDFCRRSGCYDDVVAYGDVAGLARRPAVFVDMAGEGRLLHAVHDRFGDALKHSCVVGATHWDKRETQHGLPGPKPQFFFAPTQVRKWAQGPGLGELERRYGASWSAFAESTRGWLRIARGRGGDAVRHAWLEVLDGGSAPERGHILCL